MIKKRVLVLAFTLALLGSHSLLYAADGNGYEPGMTTLSGSSAMSARDIALHNTTMSGNLMAGQDVSCDECNISGSIKAGRDVNLNDCKQVYSIMAGRSAMLSGTEVQTHVLAGSTLQLHDSEIGGSVKAGGEIQPRDSRIFGELATGAHRLVLTHTTTGDIRFSPPNSNSEVMNGSIIGNGNIIGNGGSIIGNGIMVGSGSGIVSSNGRSVFSNSGGNSMAVIQGYQINSTPTQTTVTTPDQTIYINGKKISGPGPSRYDDYQHAHLDAPTINTPAWTQAMAKMPQKATTQKSNTKREAVNILELTENSTVNGNIYFESGYGKVIVHPGSVFRGKVTNGTVQNLT